MDPINPLDRLTSLLRKRLDGKSSSKGKTQGNSLAKPHQRSVSTDVLRQQIKKSIEAIDLDDPERDRKATRMFVTNVLVWQFGDTMLNDGGFVSLVDDVQAALEQDSGFHASLWASFAPPKK